MRLAVLISLCVLIVAGSIGSLVFYANWNRDRYDPLIIEAATQYDLHPALLKAIIDVRGHFNYYAGGEKGEVGLLQVPQEGVRAYKTQVMKNPDYDFGWICINKAHPPHNKTIRQKLPGVCNICRTPLIRGELYPKKNIEVGAWYLAKLTSDIEKATGQNGKDVVPLVVAAYCLTEKTVREVTNDYGSLQLPTRLYSSIKDVLDVYRRYKRKGLK
ncbi:transglycosylase SLT domain-containing protein [bacterium]|nr:transglycosylase SLT domain-containing protein [bacterium]